MRGIPGMKFVSLWVCAMFALCGGITKAATHVWELQDLELEAANKYTNSYTDVTCWIELTGPDFAKRIYGFWDGGRTFRVRFVATTPGKWTWKSGSNQNDSGLNGKSGELSVVNWIEAEKEQNPNRRGFVHATPNGHALQYADGTPFFMLGDTWLAAATWRLPFTGETPVADYEPGPGITFEDAVAYRKRQGYNSVSMIAAFPTWSSDHYPNTYADKNGVYYRNAWEKFGVIVEGDRPTAKDMHDERGYRPFEILPNREGLPNFDRVIPAYFQSLDKKMQYLNDQGMIAMLETVRRDNCPPWAAYFDFKESYTRFVEYMVARYGAYNMVFSKIHLDVIPRNTSLTAEQYNEALTYHLNKYGPMPFGQPVTTLINHSTYKTFGHGDKAPWITMHSVGNNPRDHGIYPEIETLFHLDPPYPAIDLEPYYAGWSHRINQPAGENPPPNSDRDNYFARAQMYGCVLSGALAGHVYGTAAYDITTTGEPAGSRPYFWDALRYTSGSQMQYLKAFILSEGRKYRDLLPMQEDINPHKAPGSPERGLDGWAFLMRTADKDLAFLYFENKALRATVTNAKPNTTHRFTWYNTRTGEWLPSVNLECDSQGKLQLPPFPGGDDETSVDWAAKLVISSATALELKTPYRPNIRSH
jgi:Protein of unknown function (DUF4038)/Domain of unknown function (DUF5060)